ncbi:unnamed protein product [Protopolystoma xenopodis]|uniref:Uncharacterized protein n=1 Tax=Protopolystoma xenopodis TaxID=117903 RepID=A0A3S5CBC8_9PLAT|nr:unnamed protein product [Protopolystoma xenopodis]
MVAVVTSTGNSSGGHRQGQFMQAFQTEGLLRVASSPVREIAGRNRSTIILSRSPSVHPYRYEAISCTQTPTQPDFALCARNWRPIAPSQAELPTASA